MKLDPKTVEKREDPFPEDGPEDANDVGCVGFGVYTGGVSRAHADHVCSYKK